MRILAMVTLGLMLAAPAQSSSAAGGRNYDPSTVETVEGRIVSVERVPSPGGGRGAGVHVTIQIGKDAIAVHLGPAWFVDAQKTRLQSGDEVEVEGSRVSMDGKPVIIAREVRKGEQVLTLRDGAGIPVWAGRGGGGRGGPPSP